MTDLGQLREEIETAEATIESLSAEKAREKHRRIAAEASARRWEARQRSTEQKLGYEEKLRGQAEADADTQFKLRAQAEAGIQTIKALLDEVEQREARRCGTCALWQEWKPGLWDCAEDWCGYSTNPETFGCTRWEQRREG